MKFEKIKPGDILYDAYKTRMGHTTLRTVSVFEVRIIEINPEGRCALVSWNTNSPRRMGARELEKLRGSRPKLVASSFGSHRFQTGAERKIDRENARRAKAEGA